MNCVFLAKSAVIPTAPKKTLEEDEAITKHIIRIETVGNAAEKAERDGIVPTEDTEKLYDAMVHVLGDIIESIKDVNNAYKFLDAKGIERVLVSNLVLSYPELRNRLLILMDVLFEVAPITTNALTPASVVDRLLDIFENDENLALKARALDVLYLWLPNNPTVQARVMKVKGLEPFYHQVAKLDTSVIRTLLELFNKILKEHIEARNENIQNTKADLDRLRLYQKIGLIERMSTPTVCNGLLNIFEIAWQNNAKDTNTLIPVFEIINNIKPFCIEIYKGKKKALQFFETLSRFVTDPEKKDLMVSFNLSEVQSVIQDYVEKLKITAKDEF